MATLLAGTMPASEQALTPDYDSQGAPLKGGELISAVVVSIDREGALVAIDRGKSDGLICDGNFQVGDTVDALVADAEDEGGFVLLTLRGVRAELHYRRLNALLESKAPVSVKVTDSNRGGLVVSGEEVLQGFVPNRHALGRPQIGDELQVVVIEVERRSRGQAMCVCSHREALSAQDIRALRTALSEKTPVSVQALNTNSGGIVCKYGNARVFVPRREAGDLEPGMQAEVLLERVSDGGAVASRLARQWQDLGSLEGKVRVRVARVREPGAFCELVEFPGIEGLIPRGHYPAPDTPPEGEIEVKVLRVDPARRRIALSARTPRARGQRRPEPAREQFRSQVRIVRR